MAVAAALSGLERSGNPVCRVSFPGEAPAVWHGLFGGAIVVRGDLFAVTSDGQKHPL